MIQFAAADADGSDADLECIADEIAELTAHLHAATYRLLVLLRAFDERNGWSGGFRSCAHWLSWRTGIDMGAAREKVRVARALSDLPLLSDAMRRGVLSYSKVRALTRVATAASEAELLELALHGTASHIERVVRAWRRLDRLESAAQETERHESRELTLTVDEDGSYVLRARLDPEVGAVLERALEFARQALYHDGSADTAPVMLPSAAQQRADALGLIAELALRSSATSATSAGSVPVSGTRAERFQVVLHVTEQSLTGPAQRATRKVAQPAEAQPAALDGVHVSAETSRRLACDATRVVMREGPGGEVLDVGRRTRTVPAPLRRALERRDGGCRFPGCGLRCCDAHHVRHWADGGATSQDNLVLLCRFHHRLLHEGGYTMARHSDGTFGFHAPDGSLMQEAPPLPSLENAGDATLRRHHRQHGIRITASTAPVWSGGGMDLDLAMSALRPPEQ